MSFETVSLVGAGAFGTLLGWYLYYINRYRTGDVQLGDLTTLVGVIGGAGITALFPSGNALFGAYGIGLFIGFFGYFLVLAWLVFRSPNFDPDWFLDGRRKRPEPPFEIPPQTRITAAPMLSQYRISRTLEAANLAAAATATALTHRGTVQPDSPETISPLLKTRASEIITICEAEWAANRSDCSGFVKAVAKSLGVPLDGTADQIVEEITGTNWTRLSDGIAAKKSADEGKLVIGGLKSNGHKTPQAHGHVVIVVSGPLDPAYNKYPTAYWGSLNGIGEKAKPLNWAWKKEDRDNVIYASKIV